MKKQITLFSIFFLILLSAHAQSWNNDLPNTATSVVSKLTPIIIQVEVKMILDADVFPVPEPVSNLKVAISGSSQTAVKPTDANGIATFNFAETGNFTVQFMEPAMYVWEISELRTVYPSSTGGDSVQVQILLTSIGQCPQLTTRLTLPSAFQECSTYSGVYINTQNTGSAEATNIYSAVVIPPAIEVVETQPLASGQSGDTLFFQLNNLKPFASASVHLKVKTHCNPLVSGQTLCWETFASMDNECPFTPMSFSAISASAHCIGDTLVRFTLKNTEIAPTLPPHTYRIIRNDSAGDPINFSLSGLESMAIDVPADGATYRIEATKYNSGERTAAAIENCGGLTPGQITPFWLEKGPEEYDFDCRMVREAWGSNQKTAMPEGVGTTHIIEANQTVQYTIDFQNTGTDTAFRVLLLDTLSASLDISTFRPIGSSHACTWQLRGNILEVLFDPIVLPDSSIHEAASRGFFSFEINQNKNLPIGTYFQNTASIVLDYNTPVVTNAVEHIVGKLTVSAQEPFGLRPLNVFPNPSAGHFYAALPNPADLNTRLVMYDITGRLIGEKQAQIGSYLQVIPGENLIPGIYFLHVIADNQLIGIKKVLKI